MKRLILIYLCLLCLGSCVNKTVENPNSSSQNKLYNIAYQLRENRKEDSAFVFFDKAKDLFLKSNDSLGAGKCLVNMAIIASNKGDYFGGQEISLRAISFLDSTNKKHFPYINSNLNNLGIATYRLKDYKQSINFYDKALQYTNVPSDIQLYLNNKANSYRELGNYTEALKLYQKVLTGIYKNDLSYARALTNISFTKWLQDKDYNAAPDLLKSLSIREKEQDFLAQNSSYSHLSDYYSVKRPDSALLFANKMYVAAKRANSPDDKLSALSKLIKLGSASRKIQYFDAYIQLNDSLQTLRNSAKNQFILIIYEVEKRKADNLKLQKDNAEKQYQIAARELWLTGAVLLFIAGAIIITLWYKKRKQKMALEAQSAIRTSQLKTSKKVHDVVANGLYRAMSEIENQEHLDKETILDRLEDMYEKSRDISYEVDLPMTPNKPFHEQVAKLADSFATPSRTIDINGNSKALWLNVSGPVKHEVEHVLQELLVNMKKHSEASHVSLKFELVGKFIQICYIDNGVGMPKHHQFKNGLTNTENRINNISGIITFDTTVEKGIKILISFPVS